MKRAKTIISFLFFSLIFFISWNSKSQEVFDINIAQTIKTIPENPTGIVSCWLMDSDTNWPRNKTNAQAFKDMGIKMIRFPYGHLSNNYLWTTPPYSDTTDIKPKIASLHEDPGSWTWAVDTTGEFKKAMDFNEFINICNDIEAEPFVCVNVLSYKYQDGPTYEELKQLAIDWVRYANILKGYNVKLWMLGNEQDLHENLLSKTEYITLYNDFANAMKNVDSTIYIAPAILNQEDWFRDVLDSCYHNIDFMTTQQYLWGASWTSGGYDTWKEFEGIHIPLIETLLSTLNSSPKPDMDVYITETNATPPSGWPDGTQNDLYRSLCWFDQCMGQLMTEKVKGNLYWCSHSPWQGEHGNGDLRNALTNDSLNNRKPTGEIIKIINENINTDFVSTNRVSGYIRNYSTYSSTKKELTIFLMNKNNQHVESKIYLHNLSAPSSYSRRVYTGTNRHDTLPVFSEKGNITLNDSGFVTTLDSISLTIIKLFDVSRIEEPAAPINKYIWIKSYITDQYLTTSANQLQATADTITDSSQVFYVEAGENGFIRLKTMAGKGGYVEAQSNDQDYLHADGTLNDANLWKWKYAYEHGKRYVVLESNIHTGQHARVNDGDTDKWLDALGGTGTWARFNYGLALSDSNFIISTRYGLLDNNAFILKVPDTLYVSGFKNGLTVSNNASIEIMNSCDTNGTPVNGQDTTFVDSGMCVWVTAEDESVKKYAIHKLSGLNYIISTETGTLDSANQTITLNDSVLTGELINALTISKHAKLNIVKISNVDTLFIHDTNVYVTNDFQAWVTAEDSSIRAYTININGPINLVNETYFQNLIINNSASALSFTSDEHIKQIKIFNIYGQRLIDVQVHNKKYELAVNNVKNGVYLIKIIGNKGHKTCKIIIHK